MFILLIIVLIWHACLDWIGFEPWFSLPRFAVSRAHLHWWLWDDSRHWPRLYAYFCCAMVLGGSVGKGWKAEGRGTRGNGRGHHQR